jgi:hypothetical protein
MVVKFTTEFINYCIKLNIEGLNLCEIAKLVGCNRSNLSSAMSKQGHLLIRHKRVSKRYKQLPNETIKSMFLEGWSVQALAKHFKVARGTIICHLQKQGINTRNQHEASIIRMSKMSVDERKQLVKNANNVLRNKPTNIERLKKAAAFREVKPYKRIFGFGEEEIYNILIQSGFIVEKQVAFDVYNIDLVVNHTIAVEVSSSCRNPFRIKKNAEKIEKLVDSGYGVLWIFACTKEDIVLNLGNFISYFNKTCTNPTFVGQYRVIRCAVQRITRTRNERGQFTYVPSSVNPFIEERADNWLFSR